MAVNPTALTTHVMCSLMVMLTQELTLDNIQGKVQGEQLCVSMTLWRRRPVEPLSSITYYLHENFKNSFPFLFVYTVNDVGLAASAET